MADSKQKAYETLTSIFGFLKKIDNRNKDQEEMFKMAKSMMDNYKENDGFSKDQANWIYNTSKALFESKGNYNMNGFLNEKSSTQKAKETLDAIGEFLDKQNKKKRLTGKSKEIFDFASDLYSWYDEHGSFTPDQAKWIYNTSKALFESYNFLNSSMIIENLGIEQLTENQKSTIKAKIDLIVESKVNEQLKEKTNELKEEIAEEFEEKFETYKEELSENLSNFIDKVIEEEVQIPDEVLEDAKRGKYYHDLIEEFKVRLAIDNDVLDEEVQSAIKEAKEEIDEYKNELNEEMNKAFKLEQENKEIKAKLYLIEKCEGLTQVQKDKVMDILGEEDNIEKIDSKYDLILETFFDIKNENDIITEGKNSKGNDLITEENNENISDPNENPMKKTWLGVMGQL